MKFLLVAFALIGVSSALPVNENQDLAVLNDASLVERAILEALKLLREVMQNGSESIPVLDPFQLDHLEIGEPGTHLTIDNMVIENLATFDVPDLRVTSQGIVTVRILVNFNGYIPQIDVSVGNYNLDVAIAGVTVFGEGAASLSLVEPRLQGQIVLRARIVGGLEIESSDVRLQLKGFKSNIRGLLGDEAVSNFLNAVLEYLIPDLIDLYTEEISGIINSIILDLGNSILSTFMDNPTLLALN